jgi:hypothetical protein
MFVRVFGGADEFEWEEANLYEVFRVMSFSSGLLVKYLPEYHWSRSVSLSLFIFVSLWSVCRTLSIALGLLVCRH